MTSEPDRVEAAITAVEYDIAEVKRGIAIVENGRDWESLSDGDRDMVKILHKKESILHNKESILYEERRSLREETNFLLKQSPVAPSTQGMCIAPTL